MESTLLDLPDAFGEDNSLKRAAITKGKNPYDLQRSGQIYLPQRAAAVKGDLHFPDPIRNVNRFQPFTAIKYVV